MSAGCPSTPAWLDYVNELRKGLKCELQGDKKKYFNVSDRITQKLIFYEVISIT